MQYGEGSLGRIFALRLEEGERLNDSIETFALEHGIQRAMVIFLGAVQDGSRMVVGPKESGGKAIVPLVHVLAGIQEVLALGTLFPNDAGKPSLHFHGEAGREGGATVGCTRAGVDVWLVGEVIILEILGTGGIRKKDPQSSFQLLQFST